MRYLTIMITTLLLAACTAEPIHQGNRIDLTNAALIKQGDTKFHIEQALGSPVLKDVMHPNKAVYYEEFKDEKSGEMVKRRVEVTYDDAKRALSIERFGLGHGPEKSQ
ncbi:outer membrane protein assembly factor BamE [Mariprofundus ferrooxydans]|uniref:Outer membrane protein assembly factor BamE domain-containing protein n=1 Tax=Mariprofundus ferrooxydans PV-1 TaxID=314345 RepID=Q0EXU4_9PROT|nr:outer membrane protein assembly factor BamE [Mariprofundus ferrooxydans]EAU54108.1 hypothetical protein SPV1_00722 [Mariprofundus ferrooxydans PV-1]KON48908.1 hypothetical protein AL013_00825 [Mariprofundus ferrooxydans]